MAPPVDPATAALQRRNNSATAGAWELFAPHRAQMTGLVQGLGGGRLCVLGAGNVNDLDLVYLSTSLSEIHLVDLDADALARAHARLPEDLRRRVFVHAPVDLSGVLTRIARWQGRSISAGQIDALPAAAGDAVRAALPGPFDAVVSACLLSQLLHACGRALGVKHPQLPAVAGALVAAHLRSLGDLTRPGGVALLATDVVSSETYPLEELWGREPPESLLERLSQTGNVFTGADPLFVGRVIHEHPAVVGRFASPHLHTPWLWTLSAELTVLVYAVELRRTAA